MKDYPNEEALRKAHRIYLDAMRPFVIRCLKKIPGRTLEDLIRDVSDYEPNDDIVTVIDINNIPLLLRNHWYDIFSKEFNSDLNVQNTTWLIVEGRNFWAHPGTGDIDSESTRTHLFHVARVLGEIKNSDAKEAVETIRDRLFSDEVEEHPAEVENAALKGKLSDKSDKFAAVEAEKNKLEKHLQGAHERLKELEEIEAEWAASEERLTGVSNKLKAAQEKQEVIVSKCEALEAEKAKLTEDINTTSIWLEDAEKEKTKLEEQLKKVETENTELKANLKSISGQLEELKKVEEKEQADSFKSIPIRPKTILANDMIDPQRMRPETTVAGEWTIERVKDSLSDEVRKSHKANFSEDRRDIFYRRVAETQNIIETENWRLKPPKLNKENCAFFLLDKSVTRIRRAFGILLHTFLPHGQPVDRNGKRISDLSISSNPPRIFVAITKEEAEQLECEYGCNFFAVDGYLTFYNIPENVSELLPVLEFAYKKHSGN